MSSEDNPAAKRVAVSGASGLIGSALCRVLVDAGHHVVQLRRESTPRQPDDSYEQMHWVPAEGIIDFADHQPLDAVIHLAGRSIASRRWSQKEKELIRDSRVVATRRLAEQFADAAQPPAVFVSGSATGIYGNCGEAVVDESWPTDNDSFLGEVAIQWENACQPLLGSTTRVIHPRFGIVLSPQGGALKTMLPLFRMCLGGRLGTGQQYWSWVSLDDCVRALAWMLSESDAEGNYNVASPQPVTNAELTRLMASVLGRPAILPAPAFLLRLAMGEMADALLLNSCRVQPARLLEAGFAFHDTDLRSLLRRELSAD